MLGAEHVCEGVYIYMYVFTVTQSYSPHIYHMLTHTSPKYTCTHSYTQTFIYILRGYIQLFKCPSTQKHRCLPKKMSKAPKKETVSYTMPQPWNTHSLLPGASHTPSTTCNQWEKEALTYIASGPWHSWVTRHHALCAALHDSPPLGIFNNPLTLHSERSSTAWPSWASWQSTAY